MDQTLTTILLSEGARTLFLYGLPVVGAVVVASLLTGLLQAVTNIHDPALGYAGRLGAVVLALFATVAGLGEALAELLQSVWQ
jgi:type III secretory pathway component EscS